MINQIMSALRSREVVDKLLVSTRLAGTGVVLSEKTWLVRFSARSPDSRLYTVYQISPGKHVLQH